MYYCKECEKFFMWPEQKQLDSNLELGISNHLVLPGRMSIKLCPTCLSHNIIVAERCAECKQWCAQYSLIDIPQGQTNSLRVCPDCYEENHFIAPPGLKEE